MHINLEEDGMNTLELLQLINDSLASGDFEEVDAILKSKVFPEVEFYDSIFPFLYSDIKKFDDYKKIKRQHLKYHDFITLIVNIYNHSWQGTFVSLEEIQDINYTARDFEDAKEALFDFRHSNRDDRDLEELLRRIYHDFPEWINYGFLYGDFGVVDEILRTIQSSRIEQLQEMLETWLIQYPIGSIEEYYSVVVCPFFEYGKFKSIMHKMINNVAHGKFKTLEEIL